MSWPFPPPLPPTPAIALDVAELLDAASEAELVDAALEALVDVEEAEVTVVVMLAGDCSFKQEESPEPWTVMIIVLQARVRMGKHFSTAESGDRFLLTFRRYLSGQRHSRQTILSCHLRC
jgi:hypothetical protein